jgi:hypothetical protein
MAGGRQHRKPSWRRWGELWLVTGRNAGVNLISGDLNFIPRSMSDAHGIWLWSSGLFLLTVVTDSVGVPHPVVAVVASQRAVPVVEACA